MIKLVKHAVVHNINNVFLAITGINSMTLCSKANVFQNALIRDMFNKTKLVSNALTLVKPVAIFKIYKIVILAK